MESTEEPSDLGSSYAHVKFNSLPSKCSCSSPEPKRPIRNLVVNIDGTSNQFGLMNTNVIELYSRLASNEEQLSYYNSGVGTYAQSSLTKVLDNTIDLAIAWNFRRVIFAAYRWLSERYRPGDRIFLFGFSRGAYQVRVLAGMIEKVGLIHEGNEEQIPFAFKLYADFKSPENEGAARHFKKAFSTEGARVHFVGVWDTVSSIDVVRAKVLLPLVESCQHICIFRHALALDERRVKFLPECIMRNGKEPDTDAKEVWFAGSHSDVGGGNLPNNELNLESAPLLWMEHEAVMAGLHLRQSSVEWKIRDLEKSHPQESLKWFWWVLEVLPVRRQSRLCPRSLSRTPHKGKGRAIYPNQKIHASVAFKAAGYKPKAVFRLEGATPPSWNKVIGQGQSGKFREALNGWSGFLELDLFDLTAVPQMIENLQNGVSENDTLHILNRLSFLAISDEGQEAILHSLQKQPQVPQKTLHYSIDHGLTVNLGASKLLLDDSKEPVTVFLATAKLFAKLARSTEGHDTSSSIDLHKPYADAVTNAKVLQKVVDNLKANDEGAADAIAELAHLPEARKRILDLTAVPILVNMLKNVSAAAPKAIVALAEYEDARTAIFKEGAIPTLCEMLESNNCGPAANTIVHLAQYDDALKSILELNTIPKLGEMLNLKDSSVAVHALGQLSRHTTARTLIVDKYGQRLVTKAIAMLSGDDCGISADALAALFENDTDRSISGWMLDRSPKSLNTDVVIPLTEMLESKHDAISAAHVLSALGHARYVSLLILRTKAPSLLVDMLYDNSGPAVKALAVIIMHLDDLAKLQAQDQTISQDQIITALVELLKTERDSSAIVLSRLLELPTAQEIILTKHEHVIVTLTQLLSDSLKEPQSPVSEPVMKGLLAVADIREVRVRLLELNMISMLLMAFTDEHATSTVPKVAADTMKQLIKEYPDVRDACSDKVIKMLEETLGNKSHAKACEVIQSLAEYGSSESREMIRQSDVIPILLLLSHRGVLPRAIESDSCLMELAKSNVGPRKNFGGYFLQLCRRAARRSSDLPSPFEIANSFQVAFRDTVQ